MTALAHTRGISPSPGRYQASKRSLKPDYAKVILVSRYLPCSPSTVFDEHAPLIIIARAGSSSPSSIGEGFVTSSSWSRGGCSIGIRIGPPAPGSVERPAKRGRTAP
eukprot:3677239-Rhodomonas_salina.3